MPRTRLILSLLACLAAVVAPCADAGGEPDKGNLVAAGSLRAGGMFVTGHEARVEGTLQGDLVVVGADSTISGIVEGDVVAWGGRLTMSSRAEVTGSVLLVGTKLESAVGARVRGRVIDWADAGDVGRALLVGRGEVGVAAVQRWLWGARIASLAAWLCASLVLSVLATPLLERTAQSLRSSLVRNFVAGLAAFLAILLFAWFCFEMIPFGIGVPFLVFLAAASVAAKVFGMTAVFIAVGRWIDRARGRLMPPAAPAAATAGLLLLGAIRLLPWIGTPVWVAASLAGLGAAAVLVVSRD